MKVMLKEVASALPDNLAPVKLSETSTASGSDPTVR